MNFYISYSAEKNWMNTHYQLSKCKNNMLTIYLTEGMEQNGI